MSINLTMAFDESFDCSTCVSTLKGINLKIEITHVASEATRQEDAKAFDLVADILEDLKYNRLLKKGERLSFQKHVVVRGIEVRHARTLLDRVLEVSRSLPKKTNEAWNLRLERASLAEYLAILQNQQLLNGFQVDWYQKQLAPPLTFNLI